MKRACLLTLLLFATCVAAALECAAQPKTGILFREVSVDQVTYRYEVFVPQQWSPEKAWPVILFLHGTGHRGVYPPGDTTSVLAKRFASYQKKPEAIVVFPRCPDNGWWDTPEMEALALASLEETIKEFHGDPRRVYLTGLSMGGYGAWYLASQHPGKFAAVAPVCGGIRTPPTLPIPPVSTARNPYSDVAEKIGKTPVWVFHGSADDTVPVTESRRMAAALKTAGGRVRYSEYAGVGHNSWDRAYAEPAFFTWLLSHRLPAPVRARQSAH